MNKTIINLLENSIKNINTKEELEENSAIQQLINNADDETKKIIDEMINKRLEELSINEVQQEKNDSEVEVEKTKQNSTTELNNTENNTKSNKTVKKINAKVIFLAGAMGLSILSGSIILSNRKGQNNTNTIDITSSQVTSSNSANDVTSGSVPTTSSNIVNESTSSSNSEVTSNQTTSAAQIDNNETIYHSTEDRCGSAEIGSMIRQLEKQVDAAGIQRIEVHTTTDEERTALRATTSATLFDTGEARNIINSYNGDTTKIFNFMENWLTYYNDASEDCPLIHYADNLGIEMYSIQYQLMQYNDWKNNCYACTQSGKEYNTSYYDYLNNGYIDTKKVFPMSEVQAEQLEDLYASIFNAYYKENGIDAYYYLIDDEATVNDINEKVYNFSYPVQ